MLIGAHVREDDPVPAAALCEPTAYLNRQAPEHCESALSATAIGAKGTHRLMVVSNRAQLIPALRKGVAQAACEFSPVPVEDKKLTREFCDITGRFAESIETLERSQRVGKGRFAAFDLFFLAMAHHRLNHPEKARARLEQTKRWMDANRQTLAPDQLKELTDFRAEAEAALARPAGELPDDVFAPSR